MICSILDGKRPQVRVLLEDGLPPLNRAFWDEFCHSVGIKLFTDTRMTSRSDLDLVFVTPSGELTACQEKISHPGKIV
jgi:hypothetical protein